MNAKPLRRTFVGVLAAAAITLLAVACGGSSSSSVAPAFSSSELASRPTENWITNGGSISNQRYSPLTEINATNVGRLKGLWHVHLRSGLAGKYSGEAQPIVYEDTIYVVTGADDLFAIDARTGATKWAHRAQLNQKITTVCCGWTSRGVALGDGKVYAGQLDGRLVALDQETGKVVWSTQVARWQQGYTITSAPLYYDGRVYTGLSGAEYGIRGRVTAFDANTGKELWRFHTIPGPGEVGHETWPATGDAWKHGGASVWQTPAVDPKLGLLYFSTGNASPDLYGAARAGDNLFASSILAIDAKTGKYRWHFQEVHHDIWDYDAPSPVVLFDVSAGGRERHAIAQAGKTGFVYILDRQAADRDRRATRAAERSAEDRSDAAVSGRRRRRPAVGSAPELPQVRCEAGEGDDARERRTDLYPVQPRRNGRRRAELARRHQLVAHELQPEHGLPLRLRRRPGAAVHGRQDGRLQSRRPVLRQHLRAAGHARRHVHRHRCEHQPHRLAEALVGLLLQRLDDDRRESDLRRS
jgi:outer membrane protein assembly factor BamB